MTFDTEAVSRWYVINKNVKVYASCAHCDVSNAVHRRAWMKGTYGFSPECAVCKKMFSVSMKTKGLSSKKEKHFMSSSR